MRALVPLIVVLSLGAVAGAVCGVGCGGCTVDCCKGAVCSGGGAVGCGGTVVSVEVVGSVAVTSLAVVSMRGLVGVGEAGWLWFS